jgi:hypothetical protein
MPNPIQKTFVYTSLVPFILTGALAWNTILEFHWRKPGRFQFGIQFC